MFVLIGLLCPWHIEILSCLGAREPSGQKKKGSVVGIHVVVHSVHGVPEAFCLGVQQPTQLFKSQTEWGTFESERVKENVKAD